LTLLLSELYRWGL